MQIFHYWFLVGLSLVVFETLVPIAFPLWIGISCLFMGIISYLLKIDLFTQSIVFCILTPLITVLGRRLFPIHVEDKHDLFINRGVSRLIGQIVVLDAPIENGHVQQKIGSSVWTLKGEDMPQGSKIEIIDVDNNMLIVQKIES